MVEHVCHCDYVTEPFTFEEQFARVGDTFHMVEHHSEFTHMFKCETFSWDMDEVPSITCIQCLKAEIARLREAVRGLETALTGSSDDVPF